MRRLPPLKALRSFEAAARHQSLTIAAEELGVTHSAVSQQVKNLEAYFGQKLFERRGRSLQLSPRARAYLVDVQSCFDRLVIASGRLENTRDTQIIRVNTTPSFAMRWLIPRLAQFQMANPRTEVRVSTSPFDTIDHLSETYDIIIRRDRMERPGHECKFLLADTSTPVMAPNLLEPLSPDDPGELLQKTLLHLKSRPDAWVRWMHAAGVSVPDTLPGPIFEHFFLSLQAAISGIGVALAPCALIEDDIEQGRLVQPFGRITVKGPGFHCLFREGALSDRKTRGVLEWLFREAKEIPTIV
jgi:LysR family glycine cleavage system transcriptional activator